MSHTHHHAVNYDRAFAFGIALNVLFVAVEAFYGWQADSLALLSDAGHNLSDVLGLLLAWGGYYLARLKPSNSHTYGFGRASILAALFNALLLLVAIGGIALEAFDRFAHPVAMQGMTVIVVAAIGVVVNGVTAWLFMSGHHHDLNLRGAFLHMAADTLVSVGVVAAGALFLWTGWYWLDPFISLVIVLVILFGTWDLLRQALHLSLDGVPLSVELELVRSYLAGLPGVSTVHDLHVWAMSTSEVALTAHLVMPQGHAGDVFLNEVTQALHDRFGIEHATIQIESNGESCSLTGHA